jgi:ribosome-binding factor A
MSKRKPTRGPSQRQLKAGELIRRALAEILTREDIRDPALKGVSITISEVRAAPDLKHATVFAAPLGGENSDDVILGLNRSARFIRGKLGHYMEMKSTPRLKFVLDESFDTADEMDRLLARPEVAQDLKESPN